MRKKQAKLDRIRHEKAQRELADATFTPKINARRAPMPRSVGDVEPTARLMGNLAQYEMDRRMRVTQEDFRKAKEKALYRKRGTEPQGMYL